jgi:hypothetical protein
MKKLLLMMSPFVLLCGFAVPKLSADSPTAQPANGAAPAVAPDANANPNPMAAPTTDKGTVSGSPSGTPAAAPNTAAAPADWKRLKGTVASKDETNNQVTLKDAKGGTTQVAVDSNVDIRKEGKKVALSDIQIGDRIVLINKTPSSTQNKS